MKKKYKVSVIMGMYNCEATLQEALDSLYNQTFQDFEIILCDDGSQDNTYDIAYTNSLKHKNIHLLKNESNKGLNFTLNRCLSEATGAYIARMDADDISKPQRFEMQVNFLDNNPNFSIVSSAMEYFDENGTFKIGKVIEYPQATDVAKNTPFCHAPCMIRKEAYDAVNGYTVSDKLLRIEDYHLWFKLYSKGFKGYNISIPLYRMRDDRNAKRRRKLKNRIRLAKMKIWGIKELGLPFYYNFFSLRGIIAGLVPNFIYNYFHRK
jgi:glycosyltransferase EpsE